MLDVPLRDRVVIADSLLRAKHEVAEAVTEEFFRRHPDWLIRYGERGRKFGIEDACFHIDFLAGAIESGTTRPFQEYASWTARMLASRGIDPTFVAENLIQIGEACGTLFSTSAHDLVLAFVRAGAEASTEPVSPGTGNGDNGALAEIQRVFLQAALAGQRKAATQIALEAFQAGHSVLDIYIGVFQESQFQVGRLWESNQLSVAQEHLATAITQFVLAQVYGQIEPADAHRGNMLVTGVEGELHQLGANMVSDVLEAEGWDVRFLGTHMPHAGIIQAVEEHEASVLGISTTMLFNVPKVRSLVEDVRAKFGSDLRIVLGGSAFRFAPAVCQELGADGFAGDLRAAVEMLCGDSKGA